MGRSRASHRRFIRGRRRRHGVYISLDELLPTSRAYSKGHDSILGLMAGMIVMALSLLLMK